MKKTARMMTAALLAAMLLMLGAVTASADEDPVIYYFVDCGDYLPDTVSDGDVLGQYNSVTDQFFGEDPGTGKQWGVVDEGLNEASMTYGDGRINTTWSWAFEFNTAGADVPKEQSNRYCKDMFENGLDRVLTYKFEMPEDGEYVVEVGFSDPWNCASPVDIWLNGELASDTILVNAGETYGYAKASPVDGFITVEAKTTAATINMTYIIISDVLTNEETQNWDDIVQTPSKDDDEGTDPVTDAATEAAEDGTTADVTTAGNTDEGGESGCGSELGAAMIVTAAVTGGALVFRRKRR